MAKNSITHIIILAFCMGIPYQTILPAAAATSLDYSTIFTEANLATCNPHQRWDDLQIYINNTDFNVDVVKYPGTGAVALATISFFTRENGIWLKTIAIDPNIKAQEIGETMRDLQQMLKDRHPKAIIGCNIEIKTDATNIALQATLAELGWAQKKEYISISKKLSRHPSAQICPAMLTVPNFTIRKAAENDYPDILKLCQHEQVMPWLNCSPKNLQGYLTNKDCSKFVALRDKTIIGALISKILPVSASPTGKHAYVILSAVNPEYQKKGVAFALVDTIGQYYCTNHKVTHLDMSTMSDNTAVLTACDRHGGVIIGHKQNMCKMPTPGISPQLRPQQTADGEVMSPTELAPGLMPAAAAAGITAKAL